MSNTEVSLQSRSWPYRLIPGRVSYELRGYARQGDTVFFTFLFPVLMYSLFATIFSGEISPSTALGEAPVAGQPEISMATYYLPGLVAAGMLLSGLQNLAIDIAHDKHGGRLKLLAATPMSPITYLAGKLGQVFVTALGQLVVLFAVAKLGFGAELPTDPQLWLRFTWVFVGGLTASAMLGIALSAVPRSARSAAAVVIPIVLVLQFLSGVYIPNFELPDAVKAIAGFFPLAWLAQGMRSVFLPDGFAALETDGSWSLSTVALVMVAWLVVGVLLARLTFRWVGRNS
jgi:ABC-2 type transport system permease protein